MEWGVEGPVEILSLPLSLSLSLWLLCHVSIMQLLPPVSEADVA